MFADWLLTVKHRKPSIQDLADEVGADGNYPNSNKLREWVEYLEAVGVNSDGIQVLRRAHAAWRASVYRNRK